MEPECTQLFHMFFLNFSSLRRLMKLILNYVNNSCDWCFIMIFALFFYKGLILYALKLNM